MPELLTQQQLAQSLGFSNSGIKALVGQGMPYELVSRRRRYDLEHVEAWLGERAHQTGQITERDQAAVAEIRGWITERGKQPAAREWDRPRGDHPAYRQISATVGWRRALVLAGGPSQHAGPHGARWTEAAIVTAMRDWHTVKGSWPTADGWRKAELGRPSTSTVVKALGWRHALELAQDG